MNLTSEQLQLRQIFNPYAFKKQAEMLSHQGRFVHYTSAEVAVNIIHNKEVWMRKAITMNDFMEIEYGLGCLEAALFSEPGAKFQAVLNDFYPGFWDDLLPRFSSWIPRFKNETYLTCVSEHLEQEDDIGRLSMWRAYGGTTGVALVLNNGPFLSPSDALNAYTSPVAYLSQEQFKREFKQLVESVEANAGIIATLERERLMQYVFAAFQYAVLSTKHLGFHEEREWRIVHAPNFGAPNNLRYGIEVIRGIPQPVYKIPLKDIPEQGFVGAEIPKLLERVIIGPTQYPGPMYEAFVRLLEDAGVANASRKVCVSHIPLRQ
jgi:hypothetical protein